MPIVNIETPYDVVVEDNDTGFQTQLNIIASSISELERKIDDMYSDSNMIVVSLIRSDVSDLSTHVCDDCKIKMCKGEMIKRDGDVIVDVTEANDA